MVVSIKRARYLWRNIIYSCVYLCIYVYYVYFYFLKLDYTSSSNRSPRSTKTRLCYIIHDVAADNQTTHGGRASAAVVWIDLSWNTLPLAHWGLNLSRYLLTHIFELPHCRGFTFNLSVNQPTELPCAYRETLHWFIFNVHVKAEKIYISIWETNHSCTHSWRFTVKPLVPGTPNPTT